MAETFGMAGLYAKGPDALRAALDESMNSPGQTLFEVPIGEVPNTWSLVCLL